MDLPREEIMKRAEAALEQYPSAEVWFKYTCEACGERLFLGEPNTIYDEGECCRCGHKTKITRWGMGFVLPLGSKT